MNRRLFAFISSVIIASATLTGCAQLSSRSSSSEPISSIIETTKDSRQLASKKPLTFPTSVAIVFVPGPDGQIPRTVLHQGADKLKQQLLANPKYINSVTVVSPEDSNGKISLEKIRAMYGTEIAIVLSYQQDQRSRQGGPGGLIDATIVGAFIAPTVESVTSTIVDGKVIHIASDAMIFRASGTDSRKIRSTSYGQAAAVSDDSVDSILAATANFSTSLSKTLTKFDNYNLETAVSMSALLGGNSATPSSKARVNNWSQVDSFKLGGGGGLDSLGLGLLTALAAWHQKRKFA